MLRIQKNSGSPQCGLIHAILAPIGKFERGNCVIMALDLFSFTGNYNEFFDLALSLTSESVSFPVLQLN
jgi:hypothetical protein